MKKSIIKFAQEQLNGGGFDAGPVDGIYGNRTLRAVDNALENWGNQVPDRWRKWSKKRKLIAYIQMLCKERGIEVGKIDGSGGRKPNLPMSRSATLSNTTSFPNPGGI